MFKSGRWMFKNSFLSRRNRLGSSLLYHMAFRSSNRTVSKPNRRFEILKQFPYKFENNQTLVYDIEPSEDLLLGQLNDKLHDEDLNLYEGFKFAYHSLLDMMCEHDHRGLTGIVEPTLRKDITEELAEIVYSDVGLKIENEEDHSMKIDILDFSYHLGADINRENNRNMRLKKYKIGTSYFADAEKSKFHMYLAEDLQFGKHLIFNLEVLVRFITNLKLNAFCVNDESEELIPDDSKSK